LTTPHPETMQFSSAISTRLVWLAAEDRLLDCSNETSVRARVQLVPPGLTDGALAPAQLFILTVK
jgi:hypothetical protein